MTRLLVLLLCAALYGTGAYAEDWPSLRFCYESESLAPYTGPPVGATTAPPGLVLELIQVTARQQRLRVELQQQPWKRCVLQLKQGISDGIFVAVWRADRDVWGRFPGRDVRSGAPVDANRRLWRVEYRIIGRPGGTLQWDGLRFSGLRHGVGAPLGYASSQRLRELGVLASESFAPDKVLRMVAAGRLDGYVLEREIALALIARQRMEGQVLLLPTALQEDDWYLPFSHQFYAKHPELVERFWQELGRQRELLTDELTVRYLRPERR